MGSANGNFALHRRGVKAVKRMAKRMHHVVAGVDQGINRIQSKGPEPLLNRFGRSLTAVEARYFEGSILRAGMRIAQSQASGAGFDCAEVHGGRLGPEHVEAVAQHRGAQVAGHSVVAHGVHPVGC